nr:translation initiation factor IF-2-like [Manis javanica]
MTAPDASLYSEAGAPDGREGARAGSRAGRAPPGSPAREGRGTPGPQHPCRALEDQGTSTDSNGLLRAGDWIGRGGSLGDRPAAGGDGETRAGLPCTAPTRTGAALPPAFYSPPRPPLPGGRLPHCSHGSSPAPQPSCGPPTLTPEPGLRAVVPLRAECDDGRRGAGEQDPEGRGSAEPRVRREWKGPEMEEELEAQGRRAPGDLHLHLPGAWGNFQPQRRGGCPGSPRLSRGFPRTRSRKTRGSGQAKGSARREGSPRGRRGRGERRARDPVQQWSPAGVSLDDAGGRCGRHWSGIQESSAPAPRLPALEHSGPHCAGWSGNDKGPVAVRCVWGWADGPVLDQWARVVW